MEFINDDYGSCVEIAKQLDENQKSEILNRYPESRDAFVGLLTLVESEKEKGTVVDDWECDMADIVWPEVQGK